MTTVQSPTPSAPQTTPQPRGLVDTTLPGRRPPTPSSAQVSRNERIVAYTLLILGSLLFLIPFYFLINASLKTEAQVQAGDWIRPVVLPPRIHGTEVSLDQLSTTLRSALLEIAGTSENIREIYSQTELSESEPDAGGDTIARQVAVIAVVATREGVRELRLGPDGTVLSTSIHHIGPLWSNYPRSLEPDKMNFWPALANTVVITTLSVAGQVLSCSLVGFGFARFSFRGRNILFMVMLSTMMLPPQVTMIPVFVLFRSMGMIDTFWPLVIPMWLASPFFVFMFRQFFAQIPEELIEAARIDGASNWRIYWQLMMPLSGPVIAIVSIYTFLAAWNDFLYPLIYLNSEENRTIALALHAFRGQYGVSDVHLLMAATVVAMLPCIVLFFAMQKYFVQSMAMTGLKS